MKKRGRGNPAPTWWNLCLRDVRQSEGDGSLGRHRWGPIGAGTEADEHSEFCLYIRRLQRLGGRSTDVGNGVVDAGVIGVGVYRDPDRDGLAQAIFGLCL